MKPYTSLDECHRGVLVGLFVILCAFSQEGSFSRKDFEKLEPIIGTWVSKRTRGDIYETWNRKNAQELTGMSYALAGKDTTPLETVRLYFQGKDIVYAPVAAGQNDDKEVLFRLQAIQGNRFVFENARHDFPKRIVYDFKSADSLLAYIEGEVNGQPRRVNYPYKRIH
ncbi:DUF6265 family protein [Dyadobacter sp. 676]|uniref:DUF6265 family protein n=1 Tax=Dyadobacter sp. 676 TaxID=3088362 RepID=A0AAU8FMX9_9BACT